MKLISRISHFAKKLRMPRERVMAVLKTVTIFVLLFSLLGAIALWSLNSAIVASTEDRIISPEEAATLEDIDCILVLGCGVSDDGVPSTWLADRLTVAFDLYDLGVSNRLLMSGDHGRKTYDEVNAMKDAAVEFGIPAEEVFCDHAGFSTYDSIVRAIEVFEADKIVIVTQEYHLYRALYIAKKNGIEAYGVSATLREYGGERFQDTREFLARAKDFFFTLVDADPKYLGTVVPISGNASASDG